MFLYIKNSLESFTIDKIYSSDLLSSTYFDGEYIYNQIFLIIGTNDAMNMNNISIKEIPDFSNIKNKSIFGFSNDI